MQAFIKTALVAALGLASLGAVAGEIQDTDVFAGGVTNATAGALTKAYQSIGVAEGQGRIRNSTIVEIGRAHV